MHSIPGGWRILAFLALAAAGCGGGPKIYPVEGKVVYTDGNPATDLAGYSVEFESIGGKIEGQGVSAQGMIQKDASFRMTTLKPDDGALLGEHRVIVTPPSIEGDTPTRPFTIDHRYLSYQTSGLKTKVEAKTNQITITLERRKLPAKK